MDSSFFTVHNARIYPVDEDHSFATAFSVRDDRFLAVGSDRDVQEGTRLDARGRTIVPGLVDAHAHLHELGRALRRADLTGTDGPDAVVERLLSFVEERDLPPGTWLRGHGWDETEWDPPRRPSRTVLDAAFPDRPVWLTRTDVHAGWANTAALEATVGLDRLRRMDAPEGGRILRDDAGAPTGVLVDRAMALVENDLPPPPDAEQDRALRAALRHTARHGITTLHDAGVTRTEIRRLRRFADDDALPHRVYAMALGQDDDTFAHLCEHGPYHGPAGRVHVASVKFFADGALGSRGAALLDDYADAPNHRGLLRHSPDAFRRRVQAAVEAGLQVNTHAIGDRAARMVLDAYEAAARTCERPLRRPRVEHAQIVHPTDRSRFGPLGAVASVQPAHAASDADWAGARLGADRLDRAYAWRSLREGGAVLAFGSDAPVEPIDPFRGLRAAVTAQTLRAPSDGPVQKTECLSRTAALRAHTYGGAYAAFLEDEIGTIAPGKRADWVVLSDDPVTCPPERLSGIEVVATYVGGRCVYSGDDWPDP